MNNGEIGNPALGNLQGLGGAEFFQRLLPSFIGLALVIGAIIFLFMLIWGAIQWISSGGDKQALEAARGRISNALIGIVILFATFAVLQLIHTFFGIDILSLDIGGLKL